MVMSDREKEARMQLHHPRTSKKDKELARKIIKEEMARKPGGEMLGPTKVIRAKVET